MACCAGQLVEKQSDLTGSTWTTSAQYLQGIGVVRRNGEYLHPDITRVVAVATNVSGAVTANTLSDVFGVQRYAQGTMQSPWLSETSYTEEETLTGGESGLYLAGRNTTLTPSLSGPAAPQQSWGPKNPQSPRPPQPPTPQPPAPQPPGPQPPKAPPNEGCGELDNIGCSFRCWLAGFVGGRCAYRIGKDRFCICYTVKRPVV